MGLRIANNCKVPVAFLYGIPNQPLLGGKSEDALIAETFVRYLKTRDGSWPLLFPMVKSLVRAMDTLEGFSKKKLDQPVKKFIVSGASKRGWTTWLTAAADKRVVGIVPMVIDTLNMGKQMDYQKECFGKYSRQIKDYTERGLVPMPDTATARKLWKMVDPYFYRDHYTMPKLIINGNNDPYWTVDALNLYWAGLPKNKWVLYVPNAGHNLQQRAAEGKRDLTRASNGLAAFVRHQTQNKPMPQLKWKHEDVDGKAKLTAQSTPPPNGARLWMAEAATKDFRKSRWTEGKVDIRNGTLVGLVARPKTGYRAFYMELDYTVDGLPYHLSTQIRVVGK